MLLFTISASAADPERAAECGAHCVGSICHGMLAQCEAGCKAEVLAWSKKHADGFWGRHQAGSLLLDQN